MGGVWSGGVSLGVGVCLRVSARGVCLGGVSAWGCLCLGKGGVCLGCLPGVSAKGDVCPGEVCIPACTGAAPPPLDRMTDTCENITLPQLRCGW